MIIEYTFCDEITTEVEVDDELGTFILDSRHKEHLNDRRHNDHKVSLSRLYDGEWFACFDDITTNKAELQDAFSVLTVPERRRLKMYIAGYSMSEIAKHEGISKPSVQSSLDNARKKLKNQDFFKI